MRALPRPLRQRPRQPRTIPFWLRGTGGAGRGGRAERAEIIFCLVLSALCPSAAGRARRASVLEAGSQSGNALPWNP